MKPGTYKVHALHAGFGWTNDGLEQVVVDLEVAEGPHQGQIMPWFGSFKSEKSETRTIQSLRILGWRGDDIADLTTMVDPATRQAAHAVVEEEEGKDGKKRLKVQWINSIRALGASIRKPIASADLRDFAKRKREAIARVDDQHVAKLGITTVMRPADPTSTDAAPDFGDDPIPF